MIESLKKHIEEALPFLKDKKLLIAISGGIDSVVLTHLLHDLKFDIALAHCNFQLRGVESDLDEQFIVDLGKKKKIPVFSTKFNTKAYSEKNKLSTQISARELRYNYFKELIEKHAYDFVLTAHHADDNIETFLINLTRGTGLEGLTGIPVKNGNIVRPLLPFSRLAILDYAKEQSITWREDKSNSQKKYIRNKIRHQVIPVLKEINPSLLSSFNKTSVYLQESTTIIDDKIKDISKEIITKEGEVIKFDIKKIEALSNPKAYLYQILKSYNFTEWDKVHNLLSAQTGKYLRSNSSILLKNREFLVLSLSSNVEKHDGECFYIDENGLKNNALPFELSIKNTEEIKLDTNKSILVDKKTVNYPLILRKKLAGDFFYPKGMFGKKKLSKYFKDEKLSLIEKKNIWVLCDSKDSIIWIVGLRQDRRFQINSNTKNILKISI